MPRQVKPAKATAGEVVVTAQQSRFHVDANAAPTSKEVDIKDLSISVGQKELLTQAEFRLRENVHYVLVGRNGTGKSTLLRALADGSIPGVAHNLRILLLGQSGIVSNRYIASEPDELQKAQTVLEHVLRSDASRELDLARSKCKLIIGVALSTALDDTDDPLAIVRAIRKVKHDRLLQKLALVSDIATRRSGARGAQARKDLLAVEAEVQLSEEILAQSEEDVTPEAMQKDTSDAVELLTELQSTLGAQDSDTAEVRVMSILKGLGFKDEAISKPYTSLSGGWRTRCTLAAALFQKVDILLLDECTNFLDLPAIIWLQSYIQNITDTTVVVITHDRDFSDAVADELLVLRFQKLEHFNGNLSSYEHERILHTKFMTRMKAASDSKVKHMESTIASNIAAAKRTGDDKKLKQAASRKKKIEDRTGMERGINGGRFKLNRDLGGYHLTSREAIEIPKMDPIIKIDLPSIPPDLRFPGALVSVENVTFKYKGSPTAVLKDVNLVIHPGERVGIAGLNGSGKSTLLKLAVGTEGMSNPGDALLPSSGKVERHARAIIKTFSQHSMEELEQKGIDAPSLTALKELLDVAGDSINEGEARGFLGSLGLPGRLASEVPVFALSGGQKVRLALAKLFFPPPHLLVLDEVTTHLDADTISALIPALQRYQGALLVVTHDRFFMRCVVEGENIDSHAGEGDDSDEDDLNQGMDGLSMKPGVVWRMFRGQLVRLEGGMSQYEGIAERLSKKHLVS